MQNVTVNKTEPLPDKYAIMFAPEIVTLILAGKKVKTYRFGKKYDYLQIGDIVKIQNSTTKKIVCQAKITNRGEILFKDIPVDKNFTDKENQRANYSSWYAFLGRPIADSDLFLIIEFELIR
jgi:hypothetical protein